MVREITTVVANAGIGTRYDAMPAMDGLYEYGQNGFSMTS
jgi:hypothetical protein